MSHGKSKNGNVLAHVSINTMPNGSKDWSDAKKALVSCACAFKVAMGPSVQGIDNDLCDAISDWAGVKIQSKMRNSFSAPKGVSDANLAKAWKAHVLSFANRTIKIGDAKGKVVKVVVETIEEMATRRVREGATPEEVAAEVLTAMQNAMAAAQTEAEELEELTE